MWDVYTHYNSRIHSYCNTAHTLTLHNSHTHTYTKKLTHTHPNKLGKTHGVSGYDVHAAGPQKVRVVVRVGFKVKNSTLATNGSEIAALDVTDDVKR